MTLRKWDELQLRFSLELDEAEEEAAARAIPWEEAKRISEAARLALEHQVESGTLKVEVIPWWGDYVRLIEQGWPWRVAAYIGWASAPKAKRWPKTLQELATEVLGLTGPRTIYTWRKAHPTIDTVVAMLQAAPLWEHRRDVIEALVASASNEDYKGYHDRRLFFEMIGDYTPRSKLELSGSAKDLSELSDEELDRLGGTADYIETADFTEGEG